jgi:hypothetical protein
MTDDEGLFSLVIRTTYCIDVGCGFMCDLLSRGGLFFCGLRRSPFHFSEEDIWSSLEPLLFTQYLVERTDQIYSIIYRSNY